MQIVMLLFQLEEFTDSRKKSVKQASGSAKSSFL